MPKKKTHEEYVKELSEKNPNIEVIDKYANTKTKILHRCKIDEYEWMVAPSNLLTGFGCPKCAGNIKKTHEEYTKEVRHINPAIQVVGKYKNATTNITHKCLLCNFDWEAIPSNILKGHGCPKCGIKKYSIQKIKTHQEYCLEILKINPNIEVVETYKGSKVKIKHHCLIHDVYWKAIPSNILKGCGCSKCGNEKISNKHKKLKKIYIEELKQFNSNIVLVGEYINSTTPVLHKCNKHNVIWNMAPISALRGSGCNLCGIEKYSYTNRKTNEEYIEELKIKNPDIISIEEYKDALTPIMHRCLKCNNEWFARPSNILFGKGCPTCNESHGENRIKLYLNSKNIYYIRQKCFEECKDKRHLPFDFYLPDYNKIIEFDGKQHFEPIEYFGGEEHFKIQQKHDKIKDNFCKNNGISLLRIPYFKNIEEELNNFLFI